MTPSKTPLFRGKPLEYWEQLWTPLQGGFTLYHPSLRHCVGLYRASLESGIVAVGTGVDRRGGLAKRLSDFRRPSPSARRHHSGRLIHDHLYDLNVEVLITGSDAEAREVALNLKTPLIRRYGPAWTVPNAPFMRKG